MTCNKKMNKAIKANPYNLKDFDEVLET